ncbi:hypothetical protein B296_00048933 [Ensete ventricosum]|uniref:Uncharacterized protein n=1 Tax=Ensete ventricosum TaxID=4639 RepID=A0A426XPD3_ENSVE|nr:hypothetical protein B296_00048933 [Ensete ventricosum]
MAPCTGGDRLRPAPRGDSCSRARLLAAWRSQGRLATRWHPQGATTNGMPARGNRQRHACKGQPPMASPQGAAPLARAAANRGSGACRRGNYRQARATASYVGATMVAV